MIIQGEILARGLDSGLDAGRGGSLSLSAQFLEHTGVIDARGGSGTGVINGEEGGTVSFGDVNDSNSQIVIAGSVIASGGSAEAGEPGNGGTLFMRFRGGSDLLFSSLVDLSSLADGGALIAEIQGGAFLSTAQVNASGGTTNAGGSYTVTANSKRFFTGGGSFTLQPGSIVLGGQIDLSGGSGGMLTLEIDENDNYPLAEQQPMVLFGFADIVLRGGDGKNGGAGGEVFVRAEPAESTASGMLVAPAPGNVRVDIDIDARGGNAEGVNDIAGVGGAGGLFRILARTTDNAEPPSETAVTVASGMIDVSGGDSYNATLGENTNEGGRIIVVSDAAPVDVAGEKIARGGADRGVAGVGADGGDIAIVGIGSLAVPSLDLSGGNGAFWGGDGGRLSTFSAAVSVSGRMDGGDADPLVPASEGGAIGSIRVEGVDGVDGAPADPVVLDIEREPGTGQTSREPESADQINGV